MKEKTKHTNFMYLSIFIDSDDIELKKLYIDASKKHNKKMLNEPHFYDAGFDLYLPENENEENGIRKFYKNICNKVDFKVKCCAEMFCDTGTYFTPFYTYARSSISKTPLRLANNQGIIDAGYRGNLIGMFDCISTNEPMDVVWTMETYSRILQICAPNLIPIYVNVVDSFEELGPSTSRGDGGFGSTGK